MTGCAAATFLKRSSKGCLTNKLCRASRKFQSISIINLFELCQKVYHTEHRMRVPNANKWPMDPVSLCRCQHVATVRHWHICGRSPARSWIKWRYFATNEPNKQTLFLSTENTVWLPFQNIKQPRIRAAGGNGRCRTNHASLAHAVTFTTFEKFTRYRHDFFAVVKKTFSAVL